jgi:hypothetical protein
MTTPPNQIPNPAAASPYSTPTAGRKNWFSRNWKWFVPTLVMVVFVLPLALLGSIFAAMRNLDVAKESLLRAQSNPLLVQKLGTPIEEGWLVGGSFNTSTTSGDADLAVPIAGPKGKGEIYVTAHKSAGVWSYSVMEAAIEGSDQRINLLSDVTGAEFPPTPPGTAPTPAPASQPAPSSTALPSTQGEFPGLTLTVQELKRSSNALTLKFALINQSNNNFGFGYSFGEGDKEFGSVGGIHLIDAANKKKYFVVRDADGSCVCSRNIANIAAGSQSVLWAKFPAPPDDVQKITVEIPHFPPFEDVPITR